MDGEFGMICVLYIIRKCNLGGSYSFLELGAYSHLWALAMCLVV